MLQNISNSINTTRSPILLSTKQVYNFSTDNNNKQQQNNNNNSNDKLSTKR